MSKPDFKLNAGLAALLTAAVLLSVFAGWDGRGADIVGAIRGSDALAAQILRELRLPRALLGVLLGLGLGASGAVLQGYFRNPLADPGIVGVSASAGLGAVLALYFSLSAILAHAVPIAAITGAVVGVGGLVFLAGPRASATTLILAGVAIGAIATAATALLMNLAPNPWALAEIAYWLMGSLKDASWNEVGFATPFILSGLAIFAFLPRSLDALSLGEDTARSLGVDLQRLRWLVIAGTALAVGGGVAVAGAVGFVGLVVPHLLRPLTGFEPGRLVLPSALGGASLIVLADLATRLLSGPGMPLYLGVLTALLGTPFFLWLVRTTQRHAP